MMFCAVNSATFPIGSHITALSKPRRFASAAASAGERIEARRLRVRRRLLGDGRRYDDRQREKPRVGSGSGIFVITSANCVEPGSIRIRPLSAQNIGRM